MEYNVPFGLMRYRPSFSLALDVADTITFTMASFRVLPSIVPHVSSPSLQLVYD